MNNLKTASEIANTLKPTISEVLAEKDHQLNNAKDYMVELSKSLTLRSNELDQANKEIQKLQAKCDEWVSVENGLPEQETPMQAARRNGGFDNVKTSEDVLVTDGKTVGIDLYYIESWQGLVGSPDGEITHWMPLPPPPSDKGAEDE